MISRSFFMIVAIEIETSHLKAINHRLMAYLELFKRSLLNSLIPCSQALAISTF